ncbi:hypothetical protein [Novosphingobium sp. ZW T3_23]|uniref:hypothetical protein n=1 Tax=Novosphingobium sp. ZW T3_23 TaxID=3378084 RepID=UPI003852CD8D
MLRQFMAVGACLSAICLSPQVVAAPAGAEAATAAAYSTSTTSIGDLLDNPSTKAVLVKHLPDLVSNPQIEMARGMTLKQIQSYSSDSVTDEVLAKIDADLQKIKGK